MSSGPEATVRLSSIEANAKTVSGLLGQDCVPAWVVKDDAYGLGAVETVSRLGKGTDRWYAVAFPREGMALREAGVESNILVLQPPTREEAEVFHRFQLVATVWGRDDLERLMPRGELDPGFKLPLHVELDTGMNRGGVDREDLVDLVEEIEQGEIFVLDGLYSHLADVSDLDYCVLQRKRFEDCLASLRTKGCVPPHRHLCSSGAIPLGSEYHFNMVRPGLALYGAWPGERQETPALRPVLSLAAPLVKVRSVRAGECVGYDGAFRAKRRMRVGVVAVGYAQGLPRDFPQRGRVLVRGSRAPCLGVTCMDMTLVDLSQIEEATAGDEVVLLGEQGTETIALQEMADSMNCTAYEVLCRLGGLCSKRFMD